MSHKQIAILYHGGCPDGMGGAFAAWKKFGDSADYIPVKHGFPPPEHLEGKDVYLVDFCYPEMVMKELSKVVGSLTVLDHHEGIREVAQQYPGVYDASHSGAVIAWTYFHPDTPVPKLLTYIEDGDLYRFILPHSRNILAYVYSSPFQVFEHLDVLAKELEDKIELERIITTGTFFSQHHEQIVEGLVHHADLVEFEGHECYLVGVTGEFTSDVGHRLYEMKPPIAIMLSAGATNIRVSLRSDESVDVAQIARKYGGNGHPRAAGFRLNYGETPPWRTVKTDENPRD